RDQAISQSSISQSSILYAFERSAMPAARSRKPAAAASGYAVAVCGRDAYSGAGGAGADSTTIGAGAGAGATAVLLCVIDTVPAVSAVVTEISLRSTSSPAVFFAI